MDQYSPKDDNPHYPGWYHIIPFLNCYRRGAYDSAHKEAQRFNTPGYFWDSLIRAAALGHHLLSRANLISLPTFPLPEIHRYISKTR